MILKTLENVRSHRSFTDRPLTKTELSKIVEGARLGASAKNSQSDRKSTRLNSSHIIPSRMPSSA